MMLTQFPTAHHSKYDRSTLHQEIGLQTVMDEHTRGIVLSFTLVFSFQIYLNSLQTVLMSDCSCSVLLLVHLLWSEASDVLTLSSVESHE